MTPSRAERRRASSRTAMFRGVASSSLLALVGAACLAAPPETTVTSLWRGVEEAPEQWRRLLLNESGWQVYRARNGSAYACFAFKAAEGQPEPRLSGASMALGSIAGGHGLKLYILDRDRSSRDGVSRVQYGLFGDGAKLGVNTLQIAGVQHDYPGIYSGPDVDELLALDGSKVGAEVVSLPDQPSAPPRRFKGVVDLTGIRIAHAVLMDCHALKETEMRPASMASTAAAQPVDAPPAAAASPTPEKPVEPAVTATPGHTPATSSTRANPAAATASSAAPTTRPQLHVVAPGDTLYSISRRYRCDREALADANGIAAPRYLIKAGQSLKLDACP